MKRLRRSGTITSLRSHEIKNEIYAIFASYKSIGVVSHDAGASEIISEICLLLKKDIAVSYFLSGPAIQIFKRKSLDVKNCDDINKIMNSDLILTGTGWETEIERLALENSKKNQIPCFVVLDHFQHFRSRFKKLGGEYIFPDKIIVSNLYTYYVVKNEIPEVPLIHIEDVYIESLLKKHIFLNKSLKLQKNDILYLSDGQPYDQQSDFSQISQINKIARYYRQIVKFIGKDFDKICIRPHPADLNNNKAPAKLGWIKFEEVHGDLETLVDKSTLIIGTDSLAMYAAMRLGARTLTLIDEEAKPLWLDFAATLESINEKDIQMSINNLFLCNDQTGTYVRKFSLLDIDTLHLENKSLSLARAFNCSESVYSSFDSYFFQVYKKLAKDHLHFSIIDYTNTRVGIAEVRFDNTNFIVKLKPFLYHQVTDSKDFNSGIEILIDFLKLNFVNYEIQIED